jgi:EpsI family protein
MRVPRFFTSIPARVVTLLLLLNATLLYSSLRPEFVPVSRPLAEVPKRLGSWSMLEEGVVEPEIQEVLKADDLLNRIYGNGGSVASLFVAGFKTQRNGKTPHSPKNCLPGSGWTPLNSSEMTIDVGRARPLTVNRYVVTSGERRQLVLYWYQSRDRSVASEYKAKFWVMVDAIRLNRTDTALIRVVVPIVNNNENAAEKSAVEFVRASFGAVLEHLPGV